MLTGAIIASLLAAYSALYEYWESTNKFMAIFGTSSLPVILYYALKAYMWLRKIPPGMCVCVQLPIAIIMTKS